MPGLDLTNMDPRAIGRVAEQVARRAPRTAEAIDAIAAHGTPMVVPGRGPVAMPMAAPGPGGTTATAR